MHRFSLLRFSTRFYEFSLHVHHVSVMQVGFGTELIPGTRWRKTEGLKLTWLTYGMLMFAFLFLNL